MFFSEEMGSTSTSAVSISTSGKIVTPVYDCSLKAAESFA